MNRPCNMKMWGSLLLLSIFYTRSVFAIHQPPLSSIRPWGALVNRPVGQRVSMNRNSFQKWNKPRSDDSNIVQLIRGGSTEVEEDEDVDENDEEEDEEEEDEEDDEEEDDEEEQVPESADVKKSSVTEYDDMLVPSPSLQLYSMIGIMLLSRRIDMHNPTVVRIARFIFIGYIILLQAFLFYVRLQAKATNDRTPIQISNPFSKILDSATSQQSGPVKNIASSLLTRQSTVMEYDLAQAKSMNGGLLVTMAFMWFLHFKVGQVQPLYMQTIQGLMNLYYSPLFQVYIMGRNLQRPFKNPAMSKLMDSATGEPGGETEEDSESSVSVEEETNESETNDSPTEEEDDDDEEIQEDEEEDDDKEEDEEEDDDSSE